MPRQSPRAPAALTDAQRFELLVTNVKDYAIYMLDPSGVVTSWNAGAQRFKGYLAEEIIGKHFSLFYTEEDRLSGLPERALRLSFEHGLFEAEGWRVRKDGSHFWANVVIDPIRGDDGELVGFAKVTRDVTERKKAAEQLELANQALVHAQKMEAIGHLTGGVAHDFNNLLSVLSNGLQVLNAQSRTHLDAKMIQTMQRAVDRGATLTQQLLSFARQQPLKTEKRLLDALMSEFEPMLLRMATATIKCVLHPAAENVSVSLDAARLEAALLNIAANARDAMPEGGTITVSTESVTLQDRAVGVLPAGFYARVTITDTGIGMPAAVMARALDPFFTTKEPGRGTGLGLSQVYGFITQSGGDVTIKSTEGEGTCIALYLPAVESDEVDTGYGAEVTQETVLLVEDEPDLLIAASALVQSIGYEVVTATNALDALDILKHNPAVDILFSDIVMGSGMSGLALARRAKREFPAVKIVLVSGFPLVALRRDHGDLGEFAFINKPYRLADLARVLRTL